MSTSLRQGLQAKMRGAQWRLRPILLLMLVLLLGWWQAPNGRAEAGRPAQSAPILHLHKTASVAGPVVLGEVFTYRLCYQNTGGESAHGAVLDDDLPRNLDVVAGSTGVYDPTRHRLSWNLGDLAPGPESCLDFDVRVARNDLPDVGGTGDQAELLLINNAWLNAANAAAATATHELILSSVVNPTVTKAASSTAVLTTAPITFTLTVGNDGNAPATQVVLSDALSNYLEGVSASSSQGAANYDPVAHKVTTLIGTLPPGGQVVVTIKARMRGLHPSQTPVAFSNSAIVTFNEGNQRDSNPVLVRIIGTPPPPEIPEPASVMLLAAGLAGLAGWARRRRSRQGGA